MSPKIKIKPIRFDILFISLMLDRWDIDSLIKEISHKIILDTESMFKEQKRIKKAISDYGFIPTSKERLRKY